MPRTFENLDAFRAAAGEELGTSDWITVTQDQINLFADATGDHQWIHVDPDKAAKGPFGGTIAHGYLTLSLLPALAESIYQVHGLTMGVNYGANKIRFPSPVPVGSKLRLGVKLLSVEDIAGGIQMVSEFTFEVEGAAKPSCVAEVVLRSYF